MSPKVAETDLPWEEELRRQIAPARERKGWTQYELARRASDRGLPYYQVTVQRVEEGQRQIRLNEAVVLAGLLGIDLAELVTSGSDRERLRGFMAGSLEEQARRYGQIVEAARSLILMRAVADDQLERVDPDSLDDEERELFEELSSFLAVHTPSVAVLEAEYHAGGQRYEAPGQLAEHRARWRTEQDVLEVLRLALYDEERLVPEDLAAAPAMVRRLFGVIAAAVAELPAYVDAADVPGLEELASAERAVRVGREGL